MTPFETAGHRVELARLAGAGRVWAPDRREADVDIDRMQHEWQLHEVDIFCDLSADDMERMAAAAPMRNYPAGDMIYSPHQTVESLFILKKGRVRIFRVSSDGRALTTAIVEPGTIFGEMVIVGQQMHDSFAEALANAVVCVMTRRDVQTLLLGDARIAARLSEVLGRRVGELERRLSDAVFKSVSQRIAGTLLTLAVPGGMSRPAQVKLTHEQLAALAGTSRETTTKILGEFAEAGLVGLGRGKIQLLDLARIKREAD